MKTIVVVGGGITGVSTAYYLQQKMKAAGREIKIILLEAETSLGGKIKSVYDGQFIMESGADSIVARKSNVASLIEELDLQEEVVYNATGVSYIYREDGLKQIPKDAIFGIPMSIQSLAETELVSAEGKVAALKDFYTPNETFTKEHSIGEFLEFFLGKEMVEKQISPVLSGVYSGQLHDLTIASTLPYLLNYKNKYGSIIRGLHEHKEQFQRTGDKKFLSFKNGMSSLLDRMEERLEHVEVFKGVRAERLKKQGQRYLLSLSNSELIEADVVVLSTLHAAAQRLLDDAVLDKHFDQLKNSSLISIYLGYSLADSELPKDGTGFIVAENSSELHCNACTWTSRKWEHTSENRSLLVRLFYKSSAEIYDSLLQISDEEKIQIAQADIAASLKITAEPVSYKVTSWRETMPNYHLKHPQLVAALEQQLAKDYPNVLLAGCSYYGVGIADCIANGQQTAEKVISLL